MSWPFPQVESAPDRRARDEKVGVSWTALDLVEHVADAFDAVEHLLIRQASVEKCRSEPACWKSSAAAAGSTPVFRRPLPLWRNSVSTMAKDSGVLFAGQARQRKAADG